MTELYIGVYMNDEGRDNFMCYSVICFMILRKTKQCPALHSPADIRWGKSTARWNNFLGKNKWSYKYTNPSSWCGT